MQLNKIREDLKINPNKFHNFMVYEAIKRIVSARDFDSNILSLMERMQLREEENPFFIRAKQTPTVSLEAAIKIATHWRDITKQYMYTLLLSLGKLADNVSQLDLPPEYVICALQTGITVISDDLNDTFYSLEESVPPEPDGMSYLWWEANIVRPLIAASHKKNLSTEITVAPKTQKLLQFMDKIAKNPLGFAVQLRVVESIAIDMVLFLFALFSKIEVHGEKIFSSLEVRSWITAHIEFEANDDQQIPYEDRDMMNMVRTIADQKDLFLLAEEYISCWRDALDELYGFLSGGSVADDCHEVVCHLL